MLVDPADLPTLRACFATYLYQTWRQEFDVDEPSGTSSDDGRAAVLLDQTGLLAARLKAELDGPTDGGRLPRPDEPTPGLAGGRRRRDVGPPRPPPPEHD